MHPFRSDRKKSTADGPRNTISIQPDAVTKWNQAVMEFISAVIAEKTGKNSFRELLKQSDKRLTRRCSELRNTKHGAGPLEGITGKIMKDEAKAALAKVHPPRRVSGDSAPSRQFYPTTIPIYERKSQS
jgi:hypothetical protein